MLQIRESKNGCLLEVLLVPHASDNELVGSHDGMLKVRVTAPPHDGAANAACVKLLARALELKKSQIEIIAGRTSRKKTIFFSRVTKKWLSERMAKNLEEKRNIGRRPF